MGRVNWFLSSTLTVAAVLFSLSAGESRAQEADSGEKRISGGTQGLQERMYEEHLKQLQQSPSTAKEKDERIVRPSTGPSATEFQANPDARSESAKPGSGHAPALGPQKKP